MILKKDRKLQKIYKEDLKNNCYDSKVQQGE